MYEGRKEVIVLNMPIHPNIDQSDRVFYGMIKTRNFIEALAASILTFILFFAIFFFFPMSLRLAITLVITMLVAIFFCIGINDKSVVTALTDSIKFKNRKGIATLGVPLPEKEAEKKTTRKRKDGKQDVSI